MDRDGPRFSEDVYVVDRSGDSSAVEYGMAQLNAAFSKHGVSVTEVASPTAVDGSEFVVVGPLEDTVVGKVFEDRSGDDPLHVSDGGSRAEGTIRKWCESPSYEALVLSGTDDRGIAYSVLEVADRVSADGTQAMADLDDLVEFPENETRGIDRYLVGPEDDQWFHSDEFWERYVEKLVRYRFNRLAIAFGPYSSYMCPPYPYFVTVPEYPAVTPIGLDADERERNLEQLRHIGSLCESYDVEFVLTVQLQRAWRDGSAVVTQKDDVENVPTADDEFVDYCVNGITRLLNACESIDGVQFLVNYESGVAHPQMLVGGYETDFSRGTSREFWREMISAIGAIDRDVSLDLRAKGLPDELVEFAVEAGLDVSVPTKYWTEHMGLPYHQTQLRERELASRAEVMEDDLYLDVLNHRRRYSYADLLEEPKWYDVIYRLWNHGTNRFTLWGDPDYARRFSASCGLGGADGFQVAAPLTGKGGYSPERQEAWDLFEGAGPEVDWDDDRYWFMYLLFGRLGYSTDTDPETWRREFRRRFGADGATHVERQYRAASTVLPLITAFYTPTASAGGYWPELSTGGTLEEYVATEPGDPGLFYSIEEFVDRERTNRTLVKYTPPQVADWLADVSRRLRSSLDECDADGGLAENPEYQRSKVDFRILANLAAYHCHRIEAGIEYQSYKRGAEADPGALETSLREMVSAWRAVADAGEPYHDDLVFGPPDRHGGHWRDSLAGIEDDVASVRQEVGIETLDPDAEPERGPVRTTGTGASLLPMEPDLPERWPEGADMPVEATVSGLDSLPGVKLHYRHTNQNETFNTTDLERDGDGYTGSIPGEYIDAGWDLMLYFTAERDDRVLMNPGIYNPRVDLPYYVIPVVPARDERTRR